MTAPAGVRGTRSVRQCADDIGMSPKTIRAWIHANELPARWCGNHYRVTEDAWAEFMDNFDRPRA